MKKFMDHDFLLETDTAKHLYHDYAAAQPIVDFRSRVSPQEIYEDKRFENITQLWLSGDRYKSRLMRNDGVEEHYIAGRASDREKFQKFAEALSRAIGNPLYHWCHLELQRYFGYEGVLNGETAQEVWDLCEQKLKEPDMGVRGLIKKSNVAYIATADDPCSDLAWHEKIEADPSCPVKVRPTFRPDAALNIDKPGFREYVEKLGQVAGMSITSVVYMCRALTASIEYFYNHGCRTAAHNLDHMVFREISEDEANAIFKKAMKGLKLTQEEVEGWQTSLLYHCAWEYHKRNWVMQLHFGCLRDPNGRKLAKVGAETGFDSMNAAENWAAAYKFMDAMEKLDQLPKTILYALNPADNAWLDTLVGAFQGPDVPGKVQHGAAWWFNNSKHGIEEHLTSLASMAVLGDFVGMSTDTRAFMFCSQHEYFRRILCNLLGKWVENGEYPNDEKALKEIVEGICSKNAQRYFGL